MHTIAVIDDDVYIGDMLEEVLKKEHYHVLRAYSGTEALLLLDQNHPDLILLDLMLPGLSGEEVLSKVQDIPIIVISAKVDVSDKVNLLLNGASDYLTKPFEIPELLARITVQLRSQGTKNPNSQKPSELLTYQDISLNASTHEVQVSGHPVKLTRTEFAILKLLLLNSSQVVTRSVMLDRISGDTPDCMESSLKVHISNLRKKLRDINGRDYIEAVWGIGFRLREE